MQALKTILLLLLLVSASCNNPESREEGDKITLFQGSLDSLKGPKEEIAFLKSFPFPFYKIYTVDKLGSFYLDDRIDIIKNELRTGHVWEGNIVALMKELIKPGTVAIDIGAHIGTHTISMSKFAQDQGRVIAFEPQVKLFAELVMNLLLNKCENVIAYRAAVGDAFKSIEMSPAMTGNEGGTLIGKGGDTAEMIMLDSLNLDRVSFIKIDVENFEYEVLLGAEETIRRNRPYIILEIMGNTYNPIPNREELVRKTLDKLEQMGYSLAYIEGSWSDWLATPRENL